MISNLDALMWIANAIKEDRRNTVVELYKAQKTVKDLSKIDPHTEGYNLALREFAEKFSNEN